MDTEATKTENIIIRVTPEHKALIKKFCQQNGRSVTETLLDAMDHHVIVQVDRTLKIIDSHDVPEEKEKLAEFRQDQLQMARDFMKQFEALNEKRGVLREIESLELLRDMIGDEVYEMVK